MELSKKNLIIVGGIILALILGIILLSRRPTSKPIVTNPTPGQDFNVVQQTEEVVVFNTPTPTLIIVSTPTPTPTITPTLIPTLTPTLTPTLIPTLTPVPTIRIISVRRPTRRPTATPTPDNSIKATGVSLSTTQLTLEIDKSFQVLSRVEPDDTTNKSVSWSSRDGNIATVDINGNVTGKNLGDTIITAKTSNGKTTNVRVTVLKKSDPIPTTTITPTIPTKTRIYPESIKLNHNSLGLRINDKKQLRVDIKPQAVTESLLKWSSSNGKVAIVNIRGLVTAKSRGVATITVKTVNGIRATTKITVVENQITTSAPTPIPTKTPTPTQTQITPSIPIPTKTPTIKPTKTPIPTETIIEPSSLILNPTDVNIYLRDSLQIIAEVKPDNANNKSLTWSSVNANVASVSVFGEVSTKQPGTTNIIVKTINGITAITKVTVLVNPVTPTLTPTSTKPDLTLAVMADGHIPNRPENLIKALNIAKNNKVDMLIFNGDLVQNGSRVELDQATNILKQSGIEYYVVPGNHEFFDGRGYYNFHLYFQEPAYRVVTKGNIKLILIDNQDHKNGLGTNQKNWIKDTALTNCKNLTCVAFFHIPIGGGSYGEEVGVDNPALIRSDYEWLREQLISAGVKLSVTAHTHQYKAEFSNQGLKTIILGSILGQGVRNIPGVTDSPAQYSELTIKGTNITNKQIILN